MRINIVLEIIWMMTVTVIQKWKLIRFCSFSALATIFLNVSTRFSMFLHLSVPMSQLGARWANFNEI
jgi:hypothetical protein